MGTSGSYGGSGSKPAKALRQGVSDWLDGLPESGPPTDRPPDPPDNQSALPKLAPEAVLNVVPMFRPRPRSGGGDGPGGMGGGAGAAQGDGTTGGGGRRGGAQRSAARSASTAGRAASAAYAFRTGNAGALRELGLDYDELRSSGDAIHVTRKIVEAACGPLSDGTIEDEERRKVAAEIAAWVLEEQEGQAPPTPEEIVREAIARIIFEAATTESAQQLRDGKRPEWATEEGERQIRECADALAQRAELTATGPTTDEFERAIETGIETLRRMWGKSS